MFSSIVGFGIVSDPETLNTGYLGIETPRNHYSGIDNDNGGSNPIIYGGNLAFYYFKLKIDD